MISSLRYIRSNKPHLMMACWVQAETPDMGVVGTHRRREYKPPLLYNKLIFNSRRISLKYRCEATVRV